MHRSNSIVRIFAASGLCLGLAACDNLNNQQQRTLTGAGIGAGAGAIVGAVTVGNPAAGAAVGGAGGAVVGATTH